MNAFAGTHDAAVQMIDTSIIRVHQHAACITRNVETDGLPERLQPPIIAHATTISAQNASKPSTVRWLRDIWPLALRSSQHRKNGLNLV